MRVIKSHNESCLARKVCCNGVLMGNTRDAANTKKAIPLQTAKCSFERKLKAVQVKNAISNSIYT